MKTNFKVSSKMHLFVIISCVVIALGIAVGTVCQFVAGGFYNYGADWASSKSIVVEYENIDYTSSDKLEEICSTVFSDAGIKSKKVTFVKGTSSTGGKLVYEFMSSTEDEKLNKAVDAIDAKIKADIAVNGNIRLSYPAQSSGQTLPEAGKALWRGGVAAIVLAVCGFVYFLVRYKLSMALGVLLALAHNLALFLSLVALLRVPIGSSVITFAVTVLVLTLFGCCVFFDKVRKNMKDEDNKKLPAIELVDKSACESFKINLLVPACLGAVAALLFVLMSISSLSPLAVISPLALALTAFVCSAYGLLMFVPAVYSRFKLIADKKKNTRVTAVKQKTTG